MARVGCGVTLVAMEARSETISPRILLAVDQEASSEGTADEAIRRASEMDAELVVLSVVESAQPPPPRRPHPTRRPGARQARLWRPGDRATGAGRRRSRQTYLIWEGDPAESILEASVAEGADLIMLGSRPRTNLRRLILGSVSSEVARRATCEVIVVPN